jgi:hypothetical protein
VRSIDDILGTSKTLKLNLLVSCKEEQLRVNKTWIKIGRVNQLFKLKYKLDIVQVLAHYFPGKKSNQAWLAMKIDFVIHCLDKGNHLYLTLFDGSVSPEIIKKYNNISPISKGTKLGNLQSSLDLQMAICKIVQDLINQSDREFTILGEVALQFQKEYQISITKAMRWLNLNSKFPKLIESYPPLKIQKVNNNYQVSIISNK